MNALLANCEVCNQLHLVPASAFVRGPGAGKVVINNSDHSKLKISPGKCKKCDGMIVPPEGYIEIENNFIKLLTNSTKTKEEYEKIKLHFESLLSSEKEPSPEAFLKIVETHFPEILDYLKGFTTPSSVLAIIAIFVGILGLCKESEKPQDITINQTISVDNSVNVKQIIKLGPTKKQQRNAPCVCGSGKKNKHCCRKYKKRF